MSYFTWLIAIAVVGAGLVRPAQAHFIWVVMNPESDPTEVRVYFSESAEPENPALLDGLDGARLWMAGGRQEEPKLLELKKSSDCLVAEISSPTSAGPVMLRHTYGVLEKGGSEPFLLNYYAKAYPSGVPSSWRALRDPERLSLEVVPRRAGPRTIFRVLWKGEPIAGATLAILGPDLDDKLLGVTDDEGDWEATLPSSGTYSIRAAYEEANSGEHDGKPYKSIRHYSTLALTHFPERLETSTEHLPELPQGLTSFGAAVDGDAVYIYGGNIGQTHHYHQDSHTGSFIRLDLRQPDQWQELAGGPKLQGLALVAHDGHLYRIGGFQARNKEDEEQSLWSHAECARYILAEDRWEALPDLPAGRSSHDAVVLDGSIYVVGGWDLQGSGSDAEWHMNVVKLDLSAHPLAWKTVTQLPHARRGLSVAAYDGKLYVIGGMEERGSTTRSVSIYDPRTESWSEGPSIRGTSMDGFGASAFACGDSLFVTTSSGSLQKLAADGQSWEYLAMLQHPRMFHRLVPWQDEKLIVLGGIEMGSGKVLEPEVVPVDELP